MRHGGNEQKDCYRDTEGNIPDKFGVRNELSGFKIKSQKISEDRIRCVIAEHNHEYTLNEMQGPYEQVGPA